MSEPTTAPAAAEPTSAAPATTTTVPPTGDAVTESKPATTEAMTATPAAPTSDLPKEEKVGDKAVKIKAQPIAAGNLGYKAPGLMKQFRFAAKYFWLTDSALDETALSSYVKTEKPEVGHANAAFASQTGKGLLLFAKREDDKGTPTGILNLADATDLSKDGSNDFSFKLHGHKHAFQATSGAERDSWIVAIQKAIDEAAPMKEGIFGSEGYKSQLSKYGKPFAAGAAGAAAGTTAAKSATATHPKTQDKVHDGTSEADRGTSAVATADTAPKSDKDRSRSRKRTSIFGKVLGKKDETEESKGDTKNGEEKKIEKEEKEEEKKIKKEEKKEEKAMAKAEKAEEKKEEKAEKAEAHKAEHDDKKAAKEEEAAEKKHHEQVEKEEEALAAAAAAGTTGAAATMASSEPKSATTEEPKSATTEEPKSATTEEPKSATTAATPASPEIGTPLKSKRGSIFGGLGMFGKKDKDAAATKKEEPVTATKSPQPVADTAPQLDPVDTTVPSETAPPVASSNAEATDKPVATHSPKADKTDSKTGFRGLFRPKESEAKKEEAVKPEATTSKPTETIAEGPAVATETPNTATATSPTSGSSDLKDRRRSSFFGTITGRKGKSVEPKDRKMESTSETEAADAEGKKSNKLGGLFRKSSKSAKPQSSPVTDSAAPPAPLKDTEPKVADEAAAPAATEETAPATDATTTTAAEEPATAATTTATEAKTGETATEPTTEAPASTAASVAASA